MRKGGLGAQAGNLKKRVFLDGLARNLPEGSEMLQITPVFSPLPIHYKLTKASAVNICRKLLPSPNLA